VSLAKPEEEAKESSQKEESQATLQDSVRFCT
jgi:hypothetical protein